MPISTYTYPPLRNIARAPITPPQVIHPIFPPPSAAVPRSLPIRQNEDPYRIKGFKAYRHSVNAAYPRSLNDSVGEVEPLSNPFGPVSGSSKEERSKNLKTAARKCLAARYHGQRRTIEELKGIREEPALYLGINRFIRYPSSSTVPVNPVTLIVYHANGFHKEQYEPLFSHLSELLPSTEETQQGLGKHTDEHKNGQYVEEIIMVDHYNHGDSYLLNKGLIGKLASWEDTARDLVAMLRHSLPPLESDPEGLPEHLPYHSAVSGGKVGGRKRRIIGVGHSIGGNALVRAARAHPDMFESLILIDPMTRSFDPKYQTIENPMALHMSSSCIGRRDTWPSRQSASSDLLRSPYFQRWDPLVFQRFVETGLIDLSVLSGKREDEGQVTLSTPRWVEASVFCDGTAMVHGYDALPLLPKELKIGFIMAGESSSTGGKVETHEIVHRPPSAENVIITESGHLIAQEQPKALAKEVHRILLGRPIQPDQEVRAKVEAKL